MAANTSHQETANEIMAIQSQSQSQSQNQNQSQENIKVAVRLRPFTEKEKQRQSKRIVDIEQNTVALYSPKYDESIKKFTFDYSYWSHDGFKRNQEGVNVPDPNHPNTSKYVGQEKVFEDLGRFLLANALQGYNSALLAYGQTGSGKSYTVSGYGQNEGILPRFARELFAELDKLLGPAIKNGDKKEAEAHDEATDVPPKSKTKPKPGATQTKDKLEHSEDSKSSKLQAVPKRTKRNRYEVYFSMIEIYNEVVRDLLAKQDGYQMNATAANSIARRGLRVREHPKRGFFVENLSSYPCASKEEIECLIEEGQLNKSIAATSMNETSSRGHTIYEFHIRQFRVKSSAGEESANGDADKKQQHPAQQQEVETLTTSVVQLVDLAGSERMAVHVTGGELGARPASRSSSPFGQSGTDSSGSRAPVGKRSTPSASSSTSTTTLSNANQSGSRRIAQATGAHSNQSLQVSNLLNSNNQQRFKESVSINQSLSALGNCIQVLSQFSQQQTDTSTSTSTSTSTNNNKQPKIPYRDSVLTKLLNRCCLSGNSKVVLIATLSPADANYDDTLSTLRFADRAKQIRTHAVINRSSRGTAEQQHHAVNVLQKENERLKQILDGRVTRSDDSSQTSNFDDSENMIDNFNGPKITTAGDSSTPPASSAGKPAASRSMERNASVTKARTITKTAPAAAPTSGPNQQQQKPKNNLRPAQNNLAQSKPQPNPKSPSRNSSLATTSKGGRGPELSAIKAGKLKESASNPSLPVDSEQMKQLVSSANKKMRQSTRDLCTPANATNGEFELEKDEEDYDHDDQVLSNMRKSRSLSQEMAADTGGGGANYDLDDAGATAMAKEIELATGLLDEINLNELANIIDDENLLSPDSDDSFNNGGGGRTNFDENMSKEEKITIINRLLNNSSVAGKYIRKQLEQHEQQQQQQAQQQSSNQKTPGGRMARPKRAGASLRNQRDANATTATVATTATATSANTNNELKKTNPYLSNLNPDEQLTGMISYIIQPGEMIVGKNGDCQLLVYGPGLSGRHAKLTRLVQDNDTKTSEVYIEPILPSDAAKESAKDQQATVSAPKRVALMVNGEPVLKRIKLNHLDRVLFGSTAYFVFVDNQAAATGRDGETPSLSTSLDLITYDMAHQEVLRKIMSDAENEAMIKEINDYTHRPGTGKGRPARQATDPTDELTHSSRDSSDRDNSKRSRMAQNKHLARSLTIHDGDESDPAQGAQASTHMEEPGQQHQEEQQKSQLDRIKEEEDERNTTMSRPRDPDPDLDELYRGKLMADTYEFAMPIAEANAIAKEMGIKVTYGLKILTGEEQLLLNETGACQLEENAQDGQHLEGQQQQQNEFNASNETGDYHQSQKQQSQDSHQDPQESPNEEHQLQVLISSREPIKPSSLDLPPELYVHVHLDELGVDFYWSKEKFQERRIKMLELYGAWDVGGKSGLVEYLIEQSKYQGYYMIDPFIDDIKSTWVLIGHAQVTLQPISHMSSLVESFDILDVNDELVGSVQIEALPCHQEPMDDPSKAYRVLEANELAKSFLKEPGELLGKKLVFLLKIVACSNVPDRFAQIFCQYTLNRDQTIVRTKLTRWLNQQQQHHHEGSGESSPLPNGEPQPAGAKLEFDHEHFIVIDQLSQDVLDFLTHGFLTIQLVGQYKLQEADSQLGGGGKSSSASTSATTTAQSSSSQSSSAQSQATSSQPTLVSTIISSINKYRFRMEQQSAGGGLSGQGGYQVNDSAHHHGLINYSGGSIYANSLTDSAKSGNYHRTASSGMMMNNSNSGASSVTSASATINLFDQQNDDEEGINSLNGNSQENIIDMILTKRKLDRAENQLHYIKRTINIAEHYNKKHIPVRTVKKLLNSYGQEMEGGSLDEIATEVTTDSKSNNNKHSNCVIQ